MYYILTISHNYIQFIYVLYTYYDTDTSVMTS